MKKFWKFIASMRFAIILLVILASACALASLIWGGLLLVVLIMSSRMDGGVLRLWTRTAKKHA